MRTEELIALGISDEQAAKVFELHGKEVTKLRGDMAGKDAELAAANQTIADLQAAVKKFDGVNVEKLRGDLAELQTKYNTDIAGVKLTSAVDIALLAAKAHDVRAVRPFIDMESIRLDGDKVLGLEEQLNTLRESKKFLFADEQQPAHAKTGMPHIGTEGASDKKEEVNAAVRAVFGKE